MNIINDLRINLRKLQTYKQKAVFLIVPIILLMVLSIIVTSEASNFQAAAESSIFGTITSANQTIVLSKNAQNSRFGNFQSANGGGESSGAVTFSAGAAAPGSGGQAQDLFTDTDLQQILNTPHVLAADMISTVPVSNVKATDLLSSEFTVNQLAAIDTKLASQYTDQSFAYDPNQPIPIIVNASDFVQRTENWNGQTSVTTTFTRGSNPQAALDSSPIKTQAISYSKDDLIGKQFTMNVGGLAAMQDYKIDPSSSGITFTLLTADELATQEQNRHDNISPFWNYGEIQKPITYTFKVVGVIEDNSTTYSFIPQDFATKMMNDYIQRQLTLRSPNALNNADLDSKFQGLTWDGLELRQSGVSGLGGVGGGTRLRFVFGNKGSFGGVDTSANYEIPGLVVQVDRSTNAVSGAYTDPNVYASATKSSSTIILKVDDVVNRSDVVTALNTAGYAYQDTSKLGVISELRTTLNNIVIGAAVAFVAISILVIIFTMGKFVSESRREIGVFRALGATKGEIRTLFLSQAVLYVLFGYAAGAVVGVGGVIALTAVIQSAFDNFIGKTLKQTFAVVNPVSADVFSHINWQMFAVFSLALLVITIITALIPATTAANVSPVEAIRGE